MARILSIPDVHGSHKWEAVKTIPADIYDYVVFHGDYFDSWENEWPDQGENFKAICDFVRKDSEHRKLLLGNHDWSYISGTREGPRVSGHQSAHVLEIRNLLKQNLDIIDIAFECDDWVFSHAGFSKTWVNSMKKCFHSIFDVDGYEWIEDGYCVDFLNKHFHSFNHSAEEEYFIYEFDELLDWYGFFSPSGDEKSQGPLWIRPESLLQDAYYKNQVVGHTELCLYDHVRLKQNENQIICVDSPSHEIFEVIDTNETHEFLATQDYYKVYKRTTKFINDLKSQIIYQKDAKGFVMTALLEKYPSEVADRIYKIFFRDFMDERI